MLILSLDTETTGLDFEKDRIVELGLAMWSVEDRQPVRLLGHMVKPEIDINPLHWAEAEKIHGISQESVNRYGMPENLAFKQLCTWWGTADYLVGHNALMFDLPMINAWAARHGCTMVKKPWIDTRVDLPRPLSGRLIHLAAEHNFLNPFSHRALFDALTCMKILDCYDIPTVIERSRMPNVIVEAQVSFADKDLAKNRGYQWNDYKGKKRWIRTFKDGEVGLEQREAGFKVVVLEVCPPQ